MGDIKYNQRMFAVFYGSNRNGVRDAAAKYIETNLPTDVTLTTIDAGEYQVGQVSDALGSASLFGGSECFIFDTPSLNADFYEAVKDSLAELAASANTFIILEGPLLATTKKKYGTHATEMVELTKQKDVQFNAFSLAEAVAAKDKRTLWVLLQEARLQGLREEEIIGMLWWQLKALRLAGMTTSATEAGMKVFPYSKAKSALRNFASGEVEQLSQSLLELYHDAHGGVNELDVALERWVLRV